MRADEATLVAHPPHHHPPHHTGLRTCTRVLRVLHHCGYSTCVCGGIERVGAEGRRCERWSRGLPTGGRNGRNMRGAQPERDEIVRIRLEIAVRLRVHASPLFRQTAWRPCFAGVEGRGVHARPPARSPSHPPSLCPPPSTLTRSPYPLTPASRPLNPTSVSERCAAYHEDGAGVGVIVIARGVVAPPLRILRGLNVVCSPAARPSFRHVGEDKALVAVRIGFGILRGCAVQEVAHLGKVRALAIHRAILARV